MIFEVSKSSDYGFQDTVNISTLEELEKFQRDCGHDIIIVFRSKTIEIYDGYRE